MKASSVKSVRCAIYPGQFHSQSSSAQNQQNPHWSLTVSSNLCVAVPDGATELERLRDRNQGIAPPSNADLIAIIRAKDDLICQLKTAALETDRLRDRVEQLEQLVGVDRSLTSRLRTAFGLEPGVAQVMGMLLKRDFVMMYALYFVLYSARWRRRHRR